MPVVQFSPDQQMAMLEWLENQRDAKLDLNQIIEGLKHGYFTVRIVSDSHARFTQPSEDVPGMSEKV